MHGAVELLHEGCGLAELGQRALQQVVAREERVVERAAERHLLQPQQSVVGSVAREPCGRPPQHVRLVEREPLGAPDVRCKFRAIVQDLLAHAAQHRGVRQVKPREEQMTALRDAGYQAVTIPQIIDYVENETPLPEKPVLITMDDGYTSNLVNAAPVLEELGLRATVFVIGVNEGEEIYIHNGEPLSPPRFSYEEAAPWVEKGVIDVQSHTFDMHQVASYGYSCRDGMLAMDGETDEDYHRALLADLEQFSRRRAGRVSTDLIALAFPFGYYNRGLDDALLAEGIAVTFTIDERINRLTPHDGRCLRMMGRFNVTEDCSGEELVRRLNWSAGH